MTKKNIIIILLLIFYLLPAYKINAQYSSTDIKSSTKTIKKVIGESTPDFIAKPIIFVVNTIEKFRSDVSISFEIKKTEAQKQNKDIKFYTYNFLFTIFNNKLIFYWSFVVIIFLFIRFIWHLIF